MYKHECTIHNSKVEPVDHNSLEGKIPTDVYRLYSVERYGNTAIILLTTTAYCALCNALLLA
jgi:hypothetical protein